MSWISNSLDVDEHYNGNPFTITQEEEEVLPFFVQNFRSSLIDENQIFSVPIMAANEGQEADIGEISNLPLPGVNINTYTAHEIRTTTPGTQIHQRSSLTDYHSSESKKSTLKKGSTARRSGKKDRHTKINTAKGLRDRRMRLSVQIARKFFDLQDRLGYDKASKTIEWLFSKSKKAINQLSSKASNVTQMRNNSISKKSSKSIEISEEQQKVKTKSDPVGCVFGMKKTEKSATRSTKINAKDLRDKARTRARERTREKKLIRCFEKSEWSLSDQAYYLAQLGPAGNPNTLFQVGQSMSTNTRSQENISTSESSLHNHPAIASPSGSVSWSMYGYDHEKYDDIFSGGLDSYSNNQFNLGWDNITTEFLSPNSIDFQYFDRNQGD
ncbi:uncharacterized protein LOC141678409 [Apium graveolens]|uniref:uncharacterized protein LOC141678409 n=1 Tax=Apium graveolens TaxID=4045 RepID=UPI003D791D6E